MGPNLYIFIHDAQCAEQVLKGRSTIAKPQVYEAIRDALGGDGLFSSNGMLVIIFASHVTSVRGFRCFLCVRTMPSVCVCIECHCPCFISFG